MPSLSSSIDFGQEADLSFSAQFNQGTSNYQAPIFSPPPPPRKESLRTSTAKPTSHLATVTVPPPPPVQPPAPPVVEQQLSADDLMSHWGRVGVQIHEAATHLLEKSRKSLVGDGSYVGFVVATLTRVPAAVQPTPPYESFGYLSYSQSGNSVQRRASDIMPGDIIELHDAKFKGHKGLQSYHQNVGIGERLVAVVADFEVKKSKVKVFQANQHVGQQSVETASYRLEDLKSGSVKVWFLTASLSLPLTRLLVLSGLSGFGGMIHKGIYQTISSPLIVSYRLPSIVLLFSS
ncbi:hypothetical protein NLI96_g12698 [Meripilus lineatus]|uniref:BBC1/AIM3 cysteine proteinase-fold domain-containing protein n=1 Tax=Meripilus lineatus TaxID=2056292 RepID=A0AAD5YC56_9APHY|nr:hypothetical protein NLI96_g12698 [Physisporinus lineatus]